MLAFIWPLAFDKDYIRIKIGHLALHGDYCTILQAHWFIRVQVVMVSSLLKVKPMKRCTIECFTVQVTTSSPTGHHSYKLWQSNCFWKATMLEVLRSQELWSGSSGSWS